MNYQEDSRVVMTLDAGGTNYVFGAIAGGREIVGPVTLPASADNLDRSLSNLVEGFSRVRASLDTSPCAISFAFPGPADYDSGIIGDLPNFPSFRGGIALGPYLEQKFGVPVYINNDGNLFAYGEAMTGILPEVNRRLAEAGSSKKFKNLLGITLGTGFGAGVVIDGCLLTGDNGCGGDVWCLRNKKYPDNIAEDSASIRAVRRVYRELSGDTADLTPKDIFDIAEGLRNGDRESARASFAELGEIAGDAVASAITLVDGIVVIGGGLAGASKYIIPAMIKEMNATTGMMGNGRFPRLQSRVYNLDEPDEFRAFASDDKRRIAVPQSDSVAGYDPFKRIGVAVCKRGTSRAIADGAYMFALRKLDAKQ